MSIGRAKTKTKAKAKVVKGKVKYVRYVNRLTGNLHIGMIRNLSRLVIY